jgi:hypothetical protein
MTKTATLMQAMTTATRATATQATMKQMMMKQTTLAMVRALLELPLLSATASRAVRAPALTMLEAFPAPVIVAFKTLTATLCARLPVQLKAVAV